MSAPFYKNPLATFDVEDRQIASNLVHNMIKLNVHLQPMEKPMKIMGEITH